MKAIVVSLLCLFIVGCGAFVRGLSSHDSPQKARNRKEEQRAAVQFEHIEEEKKEDDRKVDVNQVVARFSSAKPTPSTAPPPMRQIHAAIRAQRKDARRIKLTTRR